jgi:hypothetical protein
MEADGAGGGGEAGKASRVMNCLQSTDDQV